MDPKLDYIVNELWILAWNASVQRAELYAKGTKPADSVFREKVVKYISSDLIPQYIEDGITEEQHYQNIEGLIDYANSVGRGTLGEWGYKYGVAQKLLNLALKYHWCIGLISEPPHCPIDRIVISKTKYRASVNWTDITQRRDYQKVIEEIKQLAKAQGLSIPMWELSNYTRR
jgi:hypothetical protein